MQAVQTLLHELIDYAGLFPPAGLDMPTAVANYAEYRRGPHADLLGRFVVPVTRLHEFAAAARPHLPAAPERAPWRISVLGGADLVAEVAEIDAFNRQHTGRALIDTIELKAAEVAEIEQALAALPPALTPYVELPLSALEQLIATLAGLGGRAKVRTGGTTPGMFPCTSDLARFILCCVAANVPFKATAGLHHPLRAVQRLTYAPDSPSGMMYGFLNVFLTAAFARVGLDAATAAELLEERDPAALHFDDDGVRWRDLFVPLDRLAQVRQHVALSFGSCSFREPVDDLKAMHLL